MTLKEPIPLLYSTMIAKLASHPLLYTHEWLADDNVILHYEKLGPKCGQQQSPGP